MTSIYTHIFIRFRCGVEELWLLLWYDVELDNTTFENGPLLFLETSGVKTPTAIGSTTTLTGWQHHFSTDLPPLEGSSV
jgi:hypothetical protein